MSELTLLVLRLAFLAAMWVFVFFVVYSIRADLFGQRVRRLPSSVSRASEVREDPRDAPFLPESKSGSSGVLASAAEDLELVLTTGSLSGNSIELSGEPVTIGRSPDSTLVIRDDYTSTHHARISVQGGNWVLTDLESTNGTWCDGSRISGSVALHVGEVVTVGETSFEIRRKL